VQAAAQGAVAQGQGGQRTDSAIQLRNLWSPDEGGLSLEGGGLPSLGGPAGNSASLLVGGPHLLPAAQTCRFCTCRLLLVCIAFRRSGLAGGAAAWRCSSTLAGGCLALVACW
jgi:hypothetical protein